jgi:hypothetical protein
LFFQLKGTQEDLRHYDCEVEFLNYCFNAPEPTFLILVNIPRDRVYWEHVDRTYISSVLGIGDLAAFGQRRKRINFSDERTIERNAQTLAGVP